jgi:hypothetical protein
VEVEPLEVADTEMVGLSEEEQSDDPASIEAWVIGFQAVPALAWSEDQITNWEAWQKTMKAHNVEAVQRQWNEGLKE